MVATIHGARVVFLGRLRSLPRRSAARLVAQAGGSVRRGFTRSAAVAVVGQSSCASLGIPRLQARLETAERYGAECWSENTFLRVLGVRGGGVGGHRQGPPPGAVLQLDAGAILAQSGLPADVLRLLVLLDIVEPIDRYFTFQDLIAARNVARLLADGVALPTVIDSVLQARRGSGALCVVRRDDGTVGVRVGDAVADLDGQLRLPLPDAGNPSVDAVFEAAEIAEERGDWETAARLYRRCFDLDRSDPTAPFNLANVLRGQGRLAEARDHFRLAAGIDPGFSEAWFNLADVLEMEGRRAAARNALARALDADPLYADALYNAALLHFHDCNYSAAAQLWRRYLAVDAEGEWARRARAGLALCDRRILE